MDITVTGVEPRHIVVLLPTEFIGDTEPGERLPAQIETIIRAFAAQGYWPLDFGEHHGTHGELLFVLADSVEEATKLAKHFMDEGGDV